MMYDNQRSGIAFFLFHGRISHCIVRDCSNALSVGFIGGTGVIDNCLFCNNSYLEAQVNTLNGYGSPHAIVNCTFIAGSNSTSKPNVSVPDADAEGAKVINCVDCGSTVPLSGPEGCFVSCPAVGTQAFVGYPNDLTPFDGALWDAGVDVSEYGVPGAAVDLAGRRRVVGTRIDIGAYEQQKPVIGHAALSTEVVGVPVEFSGACGTGSDIVWNFGDGTAEVQGKAVTHAFASAGSYCVRCRLASASDYSSGDTVRVKIVPAEANSVYVATTGSDSNPGTAAQPFATVATAVTTLGTGTGNVFIKDGVYSLTEQLAPTGPIVISSLADDPTKVTLRPSGTRIRHLMGNTGIRCQMRSMTLTGAKGYESITAGSVALLVDARLSNCIITGNSGGAGIVTLCGSAVAENCLFYNNVPVGNGEGRIYAAGVAGTSHFVNCTFLSTGHNFPAVAVDETADGWVVGCACFAKESSAITVRKDRYVSCAGNFDNADSPRWVRTTAAEAFGRDGQWVPCKESPLIDAGPTWAEYLANGGLSKTDLNGGKRRSGSRLDIGCCETRHTGFCIMFK